MGSMVKEIIHKGNSIISVETLPDYSHPVIVKKPSKQHTSWRNIPTLEKEYEMTHTIK